MFTVIDRGEMIEAQRLGQPAGVDLIVLVAFPHGLLNSNWSNIPARKLNLMVAGEKRSRISGRTCP